MIVRTTLLVSMLLLCLPAWADMLDLGEAIELGAVNVIVKDASPELLREIEVVAIDKAGAFPASVTELSTLHELALMNCPGVSEDYLASLPAELAKFQPDLFPTPPDLATTIDPTTASIVLLPYCLGSAALDYVVQPNDGLEKIYNAQSGLPGAFDNYANFAEEYERLNGEPDLHPGMQVALPTNEITIPVLKEDLEDTLFKVQQLGVEAYEVELGGFNADPGIEEEVCSDGGELEPLKSARERLWSLVDVLTFNDQLEEDRGWERDLETVRVGVLDSGILGAHLPLTKRMLRPLWLNGGEDSAFVAKDKSGAHGTAVAFSVAGGPFFSLMNLPMEAIQVVPVNIYARSCPRGECQSFPESGTVALMMPMLADRVLIANISSTLTTPIANFEDYVGEDKSLLIVASAGNKGIPLDRESKAYPAIEGGDETSNVVTVAGIDLYGNLLPGSNYSPELVDLAAWGCNVPVVEFDETVAGYKSSLASGTSFAAPQVSFAAAMIVREQHVQGDGITPIDVKFRLIASADLSPMLADKVKDGRVLNLEKALLVHTDLVELMEPGRPLLKGDVKIGLTAGKEVELCGGVKVNRSDLLKIAQVDDPAAEHQRYAIYEGTTATAGARFKVAHCPKINPTIYFTPVGGKEREIDMKDVRDLVMAMWE